METPSQTPCWELALPLMLCPQQCTQAAPQDQEFQIMAKALLSGHAPRLASLCWFLANAPLFPWHYKTACNSAWIRRMAEGEVSFGIGIYFKGFAGRLNVAWQKKKSMTASWVLAQAKGCAISWNGKDWERDIFGGGGNYRFSLAILRLRCLLDTQVEMCK